eukprot:GFUD01123979.1.p1 GENE.GFUD01123979.1~~GFUD01123979.1.p1  ORF type:complete len:137 (+),score=20.33 GFUD01123979.1:33-413(+)
MGFVMSKEEAAGNGPFLVARELAQILGTEKGQRITRKQINRRLWVYLDHHQLFDPTDVNWIIPDQTFQAVFGPGRHRVRTLDGMKNYFATKAYLEKHLWYIGEVAPTAGGTAEAVAGTAANDEANK